MTSSADKTTVLYLFMFRGQRVKLLIILRFRLLQKDDKMQFFKMFISNLFTRYMYYNSVNT